MSRPPDIDVAVLCGGLGTRLGAAAADRPKPLVEVCGRPFLEYQVDLLSGFGFRRFVFLTGHRGGEIEERLGAYRPPGGAPFEAVFSREKTPLGTGGALAAARATLSTTFLVVNGDSYLEADYGALVMAFEAPSARDASGMLAAFWNPSPSDGVEANNLALEGGRVSLYQKRGRDPRLSHVDAGVGVFRHSVFDFFPEPEPAALAPFSFEEAVWPSVARAGRLLSFEVPNAPLDIGTPERLLAFTRFVEAARLGRGVHP